MTDQPQFALVPVEDLKAMAARIDALAAMIKDATITPAPEWVPISEAAKIMGVSKDTIRRRISAGEFEARGTGKTRRVHIPLSARL